MICLCRALNILGNLDEFRKYNLKDKDLVKLTSNNEELIISVKIDENLENGAYLPNFDEKIDTNKFFKERFVSAKLQRLDNE